MISGMTNKTIAQSLDNAIANGYDFTLFTALQIAENLNQYDAQFEGKEPIELVPAVIAWQDSRRDKLGALVGFPSTILKK